MSHFPPVTAVRFAAPKLDAYASLEPLTTLACVTKLESLAGEHLSAGGTTR